MKFTTSDGIQYRVDACGLHQLNPEPFVYDDKYCAIYDDPERKAKSDQLQALRFGFIVGAHGGIPKSICDVGCGNFAFLNYVKTQIDTCFGHDIADYPVPKEVMKTDNLNRDYDVMTFFDCLEHIKNPSFVKDLQCGTLIVSVPDVQLYQFRNKGEEWFVNWFEKEYAHRKPNEHIHHWDTQTLGNAMLTLGWHMKIHSNLEDKIRYRGTRKNILTAAFKRK